MEKALIPIPYYILAMSEEIKLSALLGFAMILISTGVDNIRQGALMEGIVLILMGLLIIVIYFVVVQPSYFKRRFGVGPS